MWLAGDYLPNPIPNTGFDEFVEERALGLVGGNVVTINSLNDGLVKQVTTCIDPVKMFVLLANEELVSNPHDSDDTANEEMLKMTADAVTGAGAPSRFTRAVPLPAFTLLNCKIGLGELKGGGVLSRLPMRDVRSFDPAAHFRTPIRDDVPEHQRRRQTTFSHDRGDLSENDG